jgi:HTH-type transcriptional regulator / antitoxin HipB
MHSKLEPARKEAEQIADAVRRARNALGLRQDELALAAGVSTRLVHQIESGKPTSRLDSLAPVLQVLGLELRVSERRGPTPSGGGGA